MLCVVSGMRDEEDLFDGVSMSKEELKKREIQKRILTMAKDKYRFNYKEEGYRMPEGYEDASGRVDRIKREGALTARYEEEEQLKTEQVSYFKISSTVVTIWYHHHTKRLYFIG